jgi:hypothetical protein
LDTGDETTADSGGLVHSARSELAIGIAGLGRVALGLAHFATTGFGGFDCGGHMFAYQNHSFLASQNSG